MMKDYQKCFQFKLFIAGKQSRLNSLKEAALKTGDTQAYVKISAELVRLNQRIVAVNRKMQALMHNMHTRLKRRCDSMLNGIPATE